MAINFRKAGTNSKIDVHDGKRQSKKLRRRRPPSMAVSSGLGYHPEASDLSDATTSTVTLPSSDSGSQTVAPSSPKSKLDQQEDPQQLVISSLRTQIADLISQVTQLNGKLVKSYDRVSDLEDELHFTSSDLRGQSLKVSQLELERTQHLAALDTGLLVEKAHVTQELSRLMEKATEEAAWRGQAESARANIEQDLDDLSATLFNQANTMVAEARYDKSLSEKKAMDAEVALKSAEETIRGLQQQMQLLCEERDKGAEEVDRMRTLVGRGKFLEQPQPSLSSTSVKLSSHPPFQEFLHFVTHLRTLRPTSHQPPAISTFVTLPFLARILSEDSDPTVRLDFAPSLNWLSRRSVLNAIYTGQLIIEPMSTSTLLSESSTTTTSLQAIMPNSHSNVNCALCGSSIISSAPPDGPPPLHPLSLGRQSILLTGSSTWSSSLFKNPLASTSTPSPPLTPPPHQSHHGSSSQAHLQPQHVYVFRLAQPANVSHGQMQSQQRPTNYPLCSNGWCLNRLRTTCSLWAYIRVSVIDHIWEEELPPVLPVSIDTTDRHESTPLSTPQKEKAPPLPPRRRSKISSVSASMGSLWGALRSQPQSPVRRESIAEKQDDKDGISDELKSEGMQKAVTHEGLNPPTLVAPPLPRRSTDRSVKALPNSPSIEEKRPPPRALDSLKATLSVDNISIASKYSHTLNEENYPPVENSSSTLITPSNSQSSSTGSDGGLSDVFKTPVEELQALPLSRAPSYAPPAPLVLNPNSSPPPRHIPSAPLSPKSVPLPDSRPGTPAGILGPRSRPTSMQVDATQTPSRAASPLPTIVTSSSAGSAPPPPLPRRAAARRPVPQSDTGSVSNSPLSEKNTVLPATSQASQSPTTGGASPVDKKQEELTPVQGMSIAEDEKEVDSEKTKEEKEPEKLDNEKNATYVPPPPPRRRVNYVVPTHEQKQNADVAAADSEQVTSKAESNEEGKQGNPADLDNGAFVGESTWEERTWKELVKLREDMFWARLGGTRS